MSKNEIHVNGQMERGEIIPNSKDETNFFKEWNVRPKVSAEIHRIVSGRPGQRVVTYTYTSSEFFDGKTFLFTTGELEDFLTIRLDNEMPAKEVIFNKYGDLVSINGIEPHRKIFTKKTIFDERLFYSILLDERRMIQNFIVRFSFKVDIIETDLKQEGVIT